ncbi:DUF6090 family protein [Robiginitalea sp. IMCC44478]|uniref:DUF6090 family protein n=1 Tax=Robiginitalea sp. IMCC44478 TaxID=3459122 RepID=UPI004042DE7C
MIRFFRHLRQRLLTQNKFSKYLLYAVGEILLVVIGILIALQVNNWNEERVSEKQMTSFLKSLENDLKTDTTKFGHAIRDYENIIAIKENIKRSDLENIPMDSLRLLIHITSTKHTPVQTTFNKITNSGITQITKNDSLSENIYDYYTIELDYFNTINEFENNESAKDFSYWGRQQNMVELNAPDIPNFQNEGEQRKNVLKLLSEPQARNILKLEYMRKIRILDDYRNMKTEATNLLKEINKELKRRIH